GAAGAPPPGGPVASGRERGTPGAAGGNSTIIGAGGGGGGAGGAGTAIHSATAIAPRWTTNEAATRRPKGGRLRRPQSPASGRRCPISPIMPRGRPTPRLPDGGRGPSRPPEESGRAAAGDSEHPAEGLGEDAELGHEPDELLGLQGLRAVGESLGGIVVHL